MGVVKAWLRDDVEVPGVWDGRLTASDPVAAAVEQDPAPLVDTRVTHRLTVRLRSRVGFDSDGVPLFDWTDLLTTDALVYDLREEFDADAGLTAVKARIVLLYDGDVQVTEAASLVDEDGTRYRVGAVRQVPGRLEFDALRLAS